MIRLHADSFLASVATSQQVLTTGSWPTPTSSPCILPRELDECCKAFTDYYVASHSGRKLTWQTNMGTAELRADFGKSCGTASLHSPALG